MTTNPGPITEAMVWEAANGHEVNLAQRDLHGPDGCEDEDVIATLEFEYQPDLPVEAHNLVGWARLRLETHGDLLAAAEAALAEARPRLGQNPSQPAAWQGGVQAIVSDETVDALVAAIAKAKEVE